MGLLDLLRRRRPPVDPAGLELLWRWAPSLPDARDPAVRERIDSLLASLGDEAVPLLDEYVAAFDLLDTAEHAAHVRPWPWRGPGHPFSARRFTLAREGVLRQGRDGYLAALAEPERLAAVDTGPDLTDYDRLAVRTPWTLHALMAYVAERTGRAGQAGAPVSESADRPGRAWAPEVDWVAADPEVVPFVVEAAGIDLEPPPEVRTEVEDATRYERQARPDGNPDAAYGRHLAVLAALAAWRGAGRPDHAGAGVREPRVHLVPGPAWSSSREAEDLVVHRVVPEDLAALEHERRVDVLTGLVARGFADQVAGDLRAAFLRVADESPAPPQP